MPHSDHRSDDELITALNGGDSSAFDTLYHRHKDWVLRLAWRFTGNQDDALDVLQETFSYFFGKFPGFVLSARMTTFLFPVVRNLSIAARKKRTRHQGEQAIVDSTLARGEPGGDRTELAAVMQSLPESHRQVLLLRFVDGLSLREIAEALSIPTGTVKSRLHNGIAALKADPRVREYFE